MTSFKTLPASHYRKTLLAPTVTVEGLGFKLSLRFDKKENLLEARYQGAENVWFTALCYLIEGKNFLELKKITTSSLFESFKNDQDFLECFEDIQSKVMHPSFELLHLALDTYKGNLRNYKDHSKVVCRCSGATEEDIVAVIHESTSLNELSLKSKAGLGCRSCIKQLEKYFARQKTRRFKEKTNATWIEEIQNHLALFHLSGLEIKSFSNGILTLQLAGKLSQREEEDLTLKLQDHFEALDPDLSVLLAFSQAR